MDNPIKQINLNQLPYNPNRDPQTYRRLINKPFDLKVFLVGTCSVTVSLDIEGKLVTSKSVQLPGSFSYSQSFNSAGSRVATITVQAGEEKWQSHLRLDVIEEVTSE